MRLLLVDDEGDVAKDWWLGSDNPAIRDTAPVPTDVESTTGRERLGYEVWQAVLEVRAARAEGVR